MATRRQFLKTLAAASAFIAARPLVKASALLPAGRWEAKVVRCTCHPDLQAAFLDDPDAGACPECQTGQKWQFAAGKVPRNICPRLWKAISDKIESLESENQFCTAPADTDKSFLVSCADPTRPVIVALRRLL